MSGLFATIAALPLFFSVIVGIIAYIDPSVEYVPLTQQTLLECIAFGVMAIWAELRRDKSN